MYRVVCVDVVTRSPSSSLPKRKNGKTDKQLCTYFIVRSLEYNYIINCRSVIVGVNVRDETKTFLSWSRVKLKQFVNVFRKHFEREINMMLSRKVALNRNLFISCLQRLGSQEEF